MSRVPVMLAVLAVLFGAACADDESEPRGGGTSPTTSTTTGPPGTASVSTAASGGTSADPDSSSGAGESDAADSGTTTGSEPPPSVPIRYPDGQVHSPVTAFVADRWRAIAASSALPREDVFLKAGASSTVSPNTLYCFDDAGAVELAEHAELADTLAYFRGGQASGTSPFGRVTLAAESGRSAQWVVDGDPSPLDAEWDVIAPRTALLHYGTNDMNLGATHASALVPFHEAMMAAVDRLVARGTLPIVFGITRRGDDPAADLWVESYNAAIRGIAQSRQVPFIDLFAAVDPLPEHGLSGDGIHLRAFGGGACVLSEDGLQWGYNMRNLVALQGLGRAVEVLVDDADALDVDAPLFTGTGTRVDPVLIDAFPFAHSADTSRAPAGDIDAYPPCDDADESGPELRYRLELSEPTPLRILVLDSPDADVDVHLVEAGGDGESCIARGDRRIEGDVPAGSWDIIVDTWASGGETFVGEYLLVVLPCGPADEACAGAVSL